VGEVDSGAPRRTRIAQDVLDFARPCVGRDGHRRHAGQQAAEDGDHGLEGRRRKHGNRRRCVCALTAGHPRWAGSFDARHRRRAASSFTAPEQGRNTSTIAARDRRGGRSTLAVRDPFGERAGRGEQLVPLERATVDGEGGTRHSVTVRRRLLA